MINEPSKSTDKVEKVLARFSDVDSLFVRPNYSSIDSALEGHVDQAKPRITLLASQELEQRIRNTPADPEPYLELAKIYHAQNRFKDSLRVLDSGVQQNPDYLPLKLFREELNLRSAQDALEMAEKSHAEEPTDESKLNVERANVSFANQQIVFCQLRYERNPEQLDLLIPWASALKFLDRVDEAVGLLEKAAKDPVLRAQASYELGLCYQQTGQNLEALSSYRQSALFRAPMPDPEIKLRSLHKAFELSDRLGLIDSAVRYGKWIIEAKSPLSTKVASRIKALEQLR